MANASILRRQAPGFRAQITTTKVAVDEALAELGKLLTCASQASVAARLPSADGQAALLDLRQALCSAVDMRGALIGAHASARHMAARYIPELATGDVADTDPDQPLFLAAGTTRETAEA